ncbi:KptA family-domain-containing protein [Mycena latifolia]|nr:KptA family-domain-containing protein [Mycena latifolia]
MRLPRRLPRILQAPKHCDRRLFATDGTLDIDPARSKLFSTRLNYLLRHAAVKEQMEMLPDGYVRLSDVWDWSFFRSLAPSEFEKMLEDALASSYDRCRTRQDFDPRVGAVKTWIRSEKKHSIPSIELNAKRIRSTVDLPMAVYSLDLQGWQHAARHGIPLNEEDNFIHLVPTSPAGNYVQAAGANFDVCVFLDVVKMLAAGIKLFQMPAAGVVLTTGDVDGVLPPSVFKKVVRIQLKRETILAR